MDLIDKIKNMQIYLEHERQEFQTIDEYEAEKRLYTIHRLDEILEDYENSDGEQPSSVPQANELLPHVSGSLLLDEQNLSDELEQAHKRYGSDNPEQIDAYIEGLKDGAKYYNVSEQ